MSASYLTILIIFQPPGTFKVSDSKPSISSTPNQHLSGNKGLSIPIQQLSGNKPNTLPTPNQQLQEQQPQPNYRSVEPQHYNAVTKCFENEECVLFYLCENGYINKELKKRALFAAEYNPQRVSWNCI